MASSGSRRPARRRRRPARSARCARRPRAASRRAAPAGVCSRQRPVVVAATAPRPRDLGLRRRGRRSASARWPASSRHSAANASSAGNTATPSAPSASITAPFSRATASTVAMNSWCSRCALLTSATVGACDRGQRGDLARMVHAEFDHGGAVRVVAQPQQRQRHADVVVEVAGGGQRRVAAARRAGWTRSSASPWSCRCCRSPRSAAGELRAPGGGQLAQRQLRVGDLQGPAGRPRPGRARPARRRRRRRWPAARKSCASKRSPFSATNRSPRCSVRVSRVHARDARRGRRRPASSRAAARAPGASVIMHARGPLAARAQRGARPRRRRRTAA